MLDCGVLGAGVTVARRRSRIRSIRRNARIDGQILPGPVLHSHPDEGRSTGTISAVCCKLRSPMSFQGRGWETCGCARLTIQARGPRGRLVTENKDFIRRNSRPRAAVAKKRLESGGNPGYPFQHLKKLMSWPAGVGLLRFLSVSRLYRTGSLCCPHRMVRTPE